VTPILLSSISNEAANRDTAIELARRALQVGDDDPVTLADAAGVLAGFGEDLDLCITVTPVRLPPGAARLATRSSSTGSLYDASAPELQAEMAAAHEWLARYNAALGKPPSETRELLLERLAAVGEVP
jgi:maltose O-acetyltransferase